MRIGSELIAGSMGHIGWNKPGELLKGNTAKHIYLVPNRLSLYYDLGFCQRLIQAICHYVCDEKNVSFKILFIPSCSVSYIKFKMKHFIKNLEGDKNLVL